MKRTNEKYEIESMQIQSIPIKSVKSKKNENEMYNEN